MTNEPHDLDWRFPGSPWVKIVMDGKVIYDQRGYHLQVNLKMPEPVHKCDYYDNGETGCWLSPE
jgi:hypothetical protein